MHQRHHAGPGAGGGQAGEEQAHQAPVHQEHQPRHQHHRLQPPPPHLVHQHLPLAVGEVPALPDPQPEEEGDQGGEEHQGVAQHQGGTQPRQAHLAHLLHGDELVEDGQEGQVVARGEVIQVISLVISATP